MRRIFSAWRRSSARHSSWTAGSAVTSEGSELMGRQAIAPMFPSQRAQPQIFATEKGGVSLPGPLDKENLMIRFVRAFCCTVLASVPAFILGCAPPPAEPQPIQAMLTVAAVPADVTC